MAEVAPAPAAAPTNAPKKKAASRTKKTGPSVGELIVKAVSLSKERRGVSLAAPKKALPAGGYDVEKNNSLVKLAVKSLVTKGTLVQTKGTGVSGSFKLNKKQTEVKKPAKKAAPKATKAAAKKHAAAKKPKKVAAKKPAAKKSPKKAKKPVTAVKKATKSPKKAKNPATPKKAAKSPKRAKKPATRKKVKAVKTKAVKAKKAPKKK
ncbi:histone H1-like [Tachysurus vachellii]|uniref:histone H1-like n=1 Tax=Tachysurus vachellii TaxID=175792 RepID=UPI00296ABFDB|nr:histone H1-like [Tachysurus vachellii]